MLQINYIRQHVELVKQKLSVKHFGNTGLVDELVQLDEELRKQMGEAGCEIVKQKFELQKNVARLIELYGISPSRG